MPLVLVVLPTNSYRTPDFVAAAAGLGVDLAIASEERPPLAMGDRFVRIDCQDPEASAAAIVALADRTPIDAVVAADDAGVVVAALACERLGLPNHPPDAAASTRDKLRMRRLLSDAEVSQPDFAEVATDEDPGLGYPLVLKPRTGSASRGVVRVDGPGDLAASIERVRAVAHDLGEDGILLAETFVPGDEVALEGLMVAGELEVLALFDKPDAPQGPTFPETILVTPSSLPTSTGREVERVTRAGIAALGLRHGSIHAEARIGRDGVVYLLEVAARPIGGLCGRSLRFGLRGTTLEELVLATALGRRPEGRRQPRPSGVLMLPILERGILERVEGVEEALALEGITEVDITIPSGSRVEPLPEGDRYLGFVFAVGTTPDEVVTRLRRAVEALTIRISPR